MITYAEKHIDKGDIELFKNIKYCIDTIDVFDTPGFEEMTCHILAEAVGRIFGLKVITGYWKTNYEHSWCITKNGNIIDVYPIGAIGGPTMLAREVVYRMYNENEIHCGDTSSEKFNKCVESVINQLAQSELKLA